jgi:hypothetical protein
MTCEEFSKLPVGAHVRRIGVTFRIAAWNPTPGNRTVREASLDTVRQPYVRRHYVRSDDAAWLKHAIEWDLEGGYAK